MYIHSTIKFTDMKTIIKPAILLSLFMFLGTNDVNSSALTCDFKKASFSASYMGFQPSCEDYQRLLNKQRRELKALHDGLKFLNNQLKEANEGITELTERIENEPPGTSLYQQLINALNAQYYSRDIINKDIAKEKKKIDDIEDAIDATERKISQVCDC